jgi:hypothetical protein
VDSMTMKKSALIPPIADMKTENKKIWKKEKKENMRNLDECIILIQCLYLFKEKRIKYQLVEEFEK